MDSQIQDKRMCGDEVYDDDYFGDLLGSNIWDFPAETLEGDGLTEDWASKLGPIPSEVFGGCSADLLSTLNAEACEATKAQPIHKDRTLESQATISKLYRIPRSFEAPSPDSVLERRSSSTSADKTTVVSFGTEIAIPVRTRTKRSRSRSANSWSKSLLLIPLEKKKKKKRKKKRRNPTITTQQQPPVDEIKKCSHCEITKTPQWREGPMGPKTLCNACGVRYRSGRLFPEYRPAASPTFIPSLHSNSHRKVIEMRQKGAGTGMDDNYVVKKHLSSNSTYTRLCSS